MAVEIERKFLLRGDPASRLGSDVGEHLRQGYLAIDQAVEVRVRIGSGSAAVTVKAGRGVARTEVEMPITADEAEELWIHTVGRRIEKTRYRIDLEGAGLDRRADVAEVDIYHGSQAG
jgi:CYTH domain-containing protein